ncbi:hypothetical protein JW823_05755 [bacterium]|nr:hypothetical protein [candidate division CSSED10-310 bacterium]
MKPLNILFLWHMHQPLYRVKDSESFRLPWVRLHGTKDYLGMVELASESPAYRMTFNFTPVLWDQLDAYISGATDREIDVAVKPAESLSLTERQFLLSRMFTGNPVSLINPFPRYAELYDRFGRGGEDAAHRMTEKDITDLVVWRLLAWIYPPIRQSNPSIAGLMEKGSGFTESEKITLIEDIRHLLGQLKSKYIILEQIGQIDVSTTPYYHPILPVLLDSDVARESAGFKGDFPIRFQYKLDAEWHVDNALERHRSIFSAEPSGMWPAEGSVSMAAVELFASKGIRWIASDEAIVEATLNQSVNRDSLGFSRNPGLIYQPYMVESSGGNIAMFFRDHYLSDLIGFDYQSVNQNQALSDFINRLKFIRDNTQSLAVDPCVAIILDGENAWEHYPDTGFPFLRRLFQAIVDEPGLHLETMTAYLNRIEDRVDQLPRLNILKPGSWINGDFSIWIGQEEENRAWQYISDLNEAINSTASSGTSTDDRLAKSRLCIRKAQGSDAFWWFGDVHYTTEKQEFDALFRDNLINGYEEAELIPPKMLFMPISSAGAATGNVNYPKNLISPRIDGDIKSYFDWYGCGSVSFRSHFSAMHAVSEKPVFNELKFGFDLKNLYLRLDPGSGIESQENGIRVDLIFNNSSIATDLSISLTQSVEKPGVYKIETISHLSESAVSKDIAAAFDRILEISIPFETLHLAADQKVSFHIEIWSMDRMTGRLPDLTEIEFFIPTKDYDSILWRV